VKKCFIDLETTGLDPWVDDPEETTKKGVILSAGFVLETGEEFQVIITPTLEEWEHASPQALKVNGMTWDFLKENGEIFQDAVSEIITWLKEQNVNNEEWVFVAQNAPFDKKFMYAFMDEWLKFVNAPETWVDFIPIYKNIGALVGLNVHYQNSHHISKQLGVPEEPKPHEAIEGARALKRNYDALKALADNKKLKWPL
jgi:DNA polymerase III epsilon subunit-like protein